MLALGDLQYQKGSLDDFRNSYDKSWGALKSITKPVVGNHEYMTPGAAGYYSYFDTTEKRGYYVFEVGGWRVYVLNSNCDKIDCGTENLWFNQQLRDHPAACTLMAMHHPRYSSGLEHGSSTVPAPVLADRLPAPRRRRPGRPRPRLRAVPADGRARVSAGTKGIVSFVSGTGGKSLYHLGTRRPNSQYFQASKFGVLKLTLGDGTWSWNYRTTGGPRSTAARTAASDRPLFRCRSIVCPPEENRRRPRPRAGRLVDLSFRRTRRRSRRQSRRSLGGLNEDTAAREVAREQEFVDGVYRQLVRSAASAQALAQEGHARGRLGNEGGLVERDAMVFQAARRMATLDAAHEGLVFGRLDMRREVDRRRATSAGSGCATTTATCC